MRPEKEVIPTTDLVSKVPVSVPSHEVIEPEIIHISDNATVHTFAMEKVISPDQKEKLMERINEVSDMLRDIAAELTEKACAGMTV